MRDDELHLAIESGYWRKHFKVYQRKLNAVFSFWLRNVFIASVTVLCVATKIGKATKRIYKWKLQPYEMPKNACTDQTDLTDPRTIAENGKEMLDFSFAHHNAICFTFAQKLKTNRITQFSIEKSLKKWRIRKRGKAAPVLCSSDQMDNQQFIPLHTSSLFIVDMLIFFRFAHRWWITSYSELRICSSFLIFSALSLSFFLSVCACVFWLI